MKPVTFDGVNIVYGEGQKECQPLPAQRKENDPHGEMITCWELSPEEMEQVKETGKVWLSVYTFNQPLQPVLLASQKKDLL